MSFTSWLAFLVCTYQPTMNSARPESRPAGTVPNFVEFHLSSLHPRCVNPDNGISAMMLRAVGSCLP